MVSSCLDVMTSLNPVAKRTRVVQSLRLPEKGLGIVRAEQRREGFGLPARHRRHPEQSREALVGEENTNRRAASGRAVFVVVVVLLFSFRWDLG